MVIVVFVCRRGVVSCVNEKHKTEFSFSSQHLCCHHGHCCLFAGEGLCFEFNEIGLLLGLALAKSRSDSIRLQLGPGFTSWALIRSGGKKGEHTENKTNLPLRLQY